VCWLIVVGPVAAQTQAEKLGFPAEKKILILHADDIGMSFEGNMTAKEQLPAGRYLSCSAMAPCPWFSEFMAWCKEHPNHDVGLHITLNAEWKYYRWGPVAHRSDVPGLVDKEGCLHNSAVVSALRGKAAEVEKEIRAQIDKSLAGGWRPTHLDSHMGTCFAKPDFIEVYLKLAQEYDIPAFVPEPSPALIARLKKEGFPFTAKHVELMAAHQGPKVDDFYVLGHANSYEEKKQQVTGLIESLAPGITQIIFHPSPATEQMKAITSSWQVRDWESKIWADPDMVAYLKEEGVIQTDWRELARRYKERSAK
jgi:predicted glycoside hydrolase/deacetylase ChbG (UPF0249 family)